MCQRGGGGGPEPQGAGRLSAQLRPSHAAANGRVAAGRSVRGRRPLVAIAALVSRTRGGVWDAIWPIHALPRCRAMLRSIQEHQPRYWPWRTCRRFAIRGRGRRCSTFSPRAVTPFAIGCSARPSWAGPIGGDGITWWPRGELLSWPEVRRDSPRAVTLRDLLDEQPDADLLVSSELLAPYAGAIDILDAADPAAVTSCFTAAYGRSPVRSGSYLRTGGGVRRFSPREILRLLGFPAAFDLPRRLSAHDAWPLVGNSLSVSAVRWVLSCMPELHAPLAERLDNPCCVRD